MNLYDRYLLPTLIDLLCGIKPVQRQRAKIVPRAQGRVLEIGIGTGRNLPLYDKSRLTQLYGLDPAAQMHPKARQRMLAAGIEVELLELPAEKIPMPDASFDTVITTFTLCTIPDAPRALAELRRVLRPGGALLFVEHGRAPEPGVARWQDRLDPLWRRVAGGCHLNRKIDDLISGNGFRIDALTNARLPGLQAHGFLSEGRARPA